jgi:hypothetical protein
VVGKDMNINEEFEYKDLAVELVEHTENIFESDKLFNKHILDLSLCFKISYNKPQVISCDKDRIVEYKVIQITEDQTSYDKPIIKYNQLNGRSNVAPTYIQLMVAEKGEGVY